MCVGGSSLCLSVCLVCVGACVCVVITAAAAYSTAAFSALQYARHEDAKSGGDKTTHAHTQGRDGREEAFAYMVCLCLCACAGLITFAVFALIAAIGKLSI